MEVVAEEDQAEQVAEHGAEYADDEVEVEFGDFGEGHEVLGEDEDGEGDGFELEVALFLEDQQGQDHDQGALEGGLPEPLEEVGQGEVLDRLHGVVETRVLQGVLELG